MHPEAVIVGDVFENEFIYFIHIIEYHHLVQVVKDHIWQRGFV